VKIRHTFNIPDCEAIWIEGDTDDKTAFIGVHEDGENCRVEVNAVDLRELSVALLEVANRLDPPRPSLATLADRMFQSGFPL
jgi:hypothetical protein